MATSFPKLAITFISLILFAFTAHNVNATGTWGFGTQGLTSYYTFDNGLDNTGTDYMNRYNLSGANALNKTGKIGSALNYTGSAGSYLQSDLNLTALTKYTVCLWVYPETAVGYPAVFVQSKLGVHNKAGFYTSSNGDGKFWSYDWDGGSYVVTTSTASPSLFSWNHLCVVHNGTNVLLYFNGNLNKTGTVALNVGSPMKFVVGSEVTGGGTGNFKGRIDEVGIWNNTILTSNNIEYLYNSGSPTNEQQPPFGGDIVALYAYSAYNNTPILNFSLSTNSTTLGNLNTSFTQNTLQNFTWNSTGFQNITVTNYNVSTAIVLYANETQLTNTNKQIIGYFNESQQAQITCTATNPNPWTYNQYANITSTGGTNLINLTNLIGNHTWNRNQTFYNVNITCLYCSQFECQKHNNSLLTPRIDRYFTINITDQLLATPSYLTTTLNNIIYTYTNPLNISLISLGYNDTNRIANKSINITDGQLLRLPYNNIHNFTENTTNITITLQNNKLTLYFYNTSINLTKTEGFVQDQQTIRGFNDSSIIIIQQNLTTGLVSVRFNINNTNLTGPNAGNYTQYYDYINNLTTIINENLMLLPYVSTNAWIQVNDQSNSPLKNAIVRAYAEYYTIGQNKTMQLIGQRLTDDSGQTFFPMDLRTGVLLQVSYTGYDTQTLPYNTLDYQYSKTQPLIFNLKPTTTSNNLFILFHGPSRFNNLSQTLVPYIIGTDKNSTWTYNTSCDSTLRTSQQDNTFQTTYYFNLSLNNGFTNSCNNFILYLYDDNTLIYSKTINYTAPPTTVLTTDNTNTYNTTLIALAIIIISITIGFAIKQPNAGSTTFYIASILAIALDTSFLWIGVLAIIQFAGNLIIKRVITQ